MKSTRHPHLISGTQPVTQIPENKIPPNKRPMSSRTSSASSESSVASASAAPPETPSSETPSSSSSSSSLPPPPTVPRADLHDVPAAYTDQRRESTDHLHHKRLSFSGGIDGHGTPMFSTLNASQSKHMFDGYEDMKPKAGFMEHAYRKFVGVKHQSTGVSQWDHQEPAKKPTDDH